LKQGEILADIWVHRPLVAAVEIPPGHSVEIEPTRHPLVIVMTAECDLEWDYKTRFGEETIEGETGAIVVLKGGANVDINHPNLVHSVLMCEVYRDEEIRARVPGSDIWKRIGRNQDERYHHFEQGPIGDPPMDSLPDVYLDFKKLLALPPQTLYDSLGPGRVRRIAVVPAVYLHDLMHRFYGFLSRVGVPD
jgi:hypothetical protein